MSGPVGLTVNGEPRIVAPGTSVAELVALLDAGPKGIAVARNEDVVPRSAWSGTVVQSDDRIEILDAAQGG